MILGMPFNEFFTPEDLKFYLSQGYFISSKTMLNEEELTSFQLLCNDLVDEKQDRSKRVFVDHLHVKHGDFLHFALQSRLLDMVEEVIGPNFGLAWSAALIKNKNSKFSLDWHSDFYEDQFVEELKDHPYLSVILAATPATRESGCLEYIPRSHLIRSNRKSALGASDESSEVVFAETTAGRFLLHDPHTLHRSAPNTADYNRILINFWYISTDVSKLSADAIQYLRTKKPGRVHLRGDDSHGICALSVKSFTKSGF